MRRIWKVCGEEVKVRRDWRRRWRSRMSSEECGGEGMVVAWLWGVRGATRGTCSEVSSSTATFSEGLVFFCLTFAAPSSPAVSTTYKDSASSIHRLDNHNQPQ